MKQVFGYLKKYFKGRLTIDPSFHDWSMLPKPKSHSWTEMDPGIKEELLYDMLP